MLAVTLKADALFSAVSACCQMHDCTRSCSAYSRVSTHMPASFPQITLCTLQVFAKDSRQHAAAL